MEYLYSAQSVIICSDIKGIFSGGGAFALISADSNLAGGAQDVQHCLPGLYHGQDGLVIGQTNPGGRQVFRNPNVAVYVLLRETLHWALFLFLKTQNTNTVTYVGRCVGSSLRFLFLHYPPFQKGNRVCYSDHIYSIWADSSALVRISWYICLPALVCIVVIHVWDCRLSWTIGLTSNNLAAVTVSLPRSGSTGVICATPRCPSLILILSGNGGQDLF